MNNPLHRVTCHVLRRVMGRLTAAAVVWLPLLCVGMHQPGLAAATNPASDLTPQQKQQQRVQVIADIAPAVVCVMPATGQGGGSGVLISADGYAISNYHVTSGSGDFMKCGLNDGKLYDAVIVGIDPTGDIALIRLLGRDDFPFCKVGNSDLVQVGDEVLALGNPFLLASDFSPTVTYGIVSGVQRYQYPANSYLEYTDCIQIDASINPGNSGGPLFNIQGEWIGINGRASFEKRGRINSGAAYAISVRQILLFVEQLRAGRIVDHGRTDFTVKTAPNSVVEVAEVSQISEARRRGLRPGDELISFAGRSLTSANDFKNIVGIFPAGTRVPFTFRNRDGVQKGTVRLQPLHEFETAPEIPGGPPQRPPRPPQGPQPDGEEEGDEDHEGGLPNPLQQLMPQQAPPPPAQYAHLFEKKKSFANYYFNRAGTERLLKALEERLSAQEPAARSWSVRLAHPVSGQPSGELMLSQNAAGLLGDQWPVAHQKAGELSADSEPFEFYGLLAGGMEWFRLFRSDREQYAEIVYLGKQTLFGTQTEVEVLRMTSDTQTARWYFAADERLPIGLDLMFTSGADEARLRFRAWQSGGGVPWPAEIGVVDSNTEQLTWVKVESFDVRSGAVATPEEGGAE